MTNENVPDYVIDYPQVVGYYIDCDTAFCYSCVHSLYHREGWRWKGFEDWEAPIAIRYDDDCDTPQHCSNCGDVIDTNLTKHGYEYVATAMGEMLTSGEKNEVVMQWGDQWGCLLWKYIREQW